MFRAWLTCFPNSSMTLSTSENGILFSRLGGQKLYNGENAASWVKCAILSELLRSSKSSLKSANLQHCTFRNKIACVHYGCSMIVHALIVLLSRASPKHSPHPASCFPAQLLVCYLQLCNQALTWGKYGLSSEMRPKCGPFYHFGLHADQVCNCGPLRKHCTLNKKIRELYRRFSTNAVCIHTVDLARTSFGISFFWKDRVSMVNESM